MINLYAHDFCESSFPPIQRTSVVTRYTQYDNLSPHFLCYFNISCAFNLPLLDRFGWITTRPCSQRPAPGVGNTCRDSCPPSGGTLDPPSPSTTAVDSEVRLDKWAAKISGQNQQQSEGLYSVVSRSNESQNKNIMPVHVYTLADSIQSISCFQITQTERTRGSVEIQNLSMLSICNTGVQFSLTSWCISSDDPNFC